PARGHGATGRRGAAGADHAARGGGAARGGATAGAHGAAAPDRAAGGGGASRGRGGAARGGDAAGSGGAARPAAGGARKRRVHVRRDLSGAERAVVDPDLVDAAGEVLAPHAVAADAQRAIDGRRRHRIGARRDGQPIDVEAHRRAVIGGGQVRPGVDGDLPPAGQVVLDRRAGSGAVVKFRVVGGTLRVQRIRQLAGALFEQN